MYELQISEEEITFLTEGDDCYDDNVVMKKLFTPNVKLLLVTEGADGCRYYTKVCINNGFCLCIWNNNDENLFY